MRTRTVYFIRPIGMNGPIKIGCSISPNSRRRTLETWSPFPLEIVAEINGDYYLERRFHALFLDSHQRHEWFAWTPELQRVVDAVASGAFDVGALPQPRHLPNRNSAGKVWSPRRRLIQSYAIRIQHIEKKQQRYLPNSLTSWRLFVDDPDQMKPIEAFIADPRSHGLSRRQWNQQAIERLKDVDADWARNRIAELSIAA